MTMIDPLRSIDGDDSLDANHGLKAFEIYSMTDRDEVPKPVSVTFPLFFLKEVLLLYQREVGALNKHISNLLYKEKEELIRAFQLSEVQGKRSRKLVLQLKYK